MKRRLAYKILGNPFAYPLHKRRAAWSRVFGSGFATLESAWLNVVCGLYGEALPSRAARRSARVTRRRYQDDASRWLPGPAEPEWYDRYIL